MGRTKAAVGRRGTEREEMGCRNDCGLSKKSGVAVFKRVYNTTARARSAGVS